MVMVMMVMIMMILGVWSNTGSSSHLPTSRLEPQIQPSVTTGDRYF